MISKISKQEVQHVVKLARLGLTQKEIEKFQNELSSILDYAQKLKKVDVSKVKPTTHPYFLENVMRDDRSRKPEIERVNRLIDAVPQRMGGYVKVRSVL